MCPTGLTLLQMKILPFQLCFISIIVLTVICSPTSETFNRNEANCALQILGQLNVSATDVNLEYGELRKKILLCIRNNTSGVDAVSTRLANITEGQEKTSPPDISQDCQKIQTLCTAEILKKRPDLAIIINDAVKLDVPTIQHFVSCLTNKSSLAVENRYSNKGETSTSQDNPNKENSTEWVATDEVLIEEHQRENSTGRVATEEVPAEQHERKNSTKMVAREEEPAGEHERNWVQTEVNTKISIFGSNNTSKDHDKTINSVQKNTPKNSKLGTIQWIILGIILLVLLTLSIILVVCYCIHRSEASGQNAEQMPMIRRGTR